METAVIEKQLTRDDMREAFEGLHRDGVSAEEFQQLRKEINKEMKASSCYGGTMRMRKKAGPFMTCKCDQWKNREAVSFNRDGFVGFAGWADNRNVQPILRGFRNWVRKLKMTDNGVTEQDIQETMPEPIQN